MKHLLKDEYQNLETVAEANKKRYVNAKPFPHIYFDSFFNEEALNNILSNWPNRKKNIHLISTCFRCYTIFE